MRIELERVRFCKEPNNESQGAVKELSKLIDLFSSTKSAIE